MAYLSILKSDIELRKDLYRNIILSGGTTMLLGILERLTKELIALAPSEMKISLVESAPDQRQLQNWIGGSILSSLPTFRHMWITRA